LLSFVVGMLTLTGWHPGRAWMFIAAGLAANACADGLFLYLEATSGYSEGTPVGCSAPRLSRLPPGTRHAKRSL